MEESRRKSTHCAAFVDSATNKQTKNNTKNSLEIQRRTSDDEACETKMIPYMILSCKKRRPSTQTLKPHTKFHGGLYQTRTEPLLDTNRGSTHCHLQLESLGHYRPLLPKMCVYSTPTVGRDRAHFNDKKLIATSKRRISRRCSEVERLFGLVHQDTALLSRPGGLAVEAKIRVPKARHCPLAVHAAYMWCAP